MGIIVSIIEETERIDFIICSEKFLEDRTTVAESNIKKLGVDNTRPNTIANVAKPKMPVT